LVVVARGIWFRRNKFVFERTFTHPNEVYTAAVRFIRENKDSKQLDQSVIMLPVLGPGNGRDTTSWSPPPNGFIKLNWDAAINKIKGWIGLGIIARDYMGNCLGVRSLTKILRVDAKIAESLAALEAVYFAREAGFFDVIF